MGQSLKGPFKLNMVMRGHKFFFFFGNNLNYVYIILKDIYKSSLEVLITSIITYWNRVQYENSSILK